VPTQTVFNSFTYFRNTSPVPCTGSTVFFLLRPILRSNFITACGLWSKPRPSPISNNSPPIWLWPYKAFNPKKMIKVLLPLLLCPIFLFSAYSWYLLPILFSLILFIFSFFFGEGISSLLIISPYLFLDGLSWALIILTFWIITLRILARQQIVHKSHNISLFLFISFLLLRSLVYCFIRNNFFIFYLFFEAALIPTLLLILFWGYQPERLQAGIYLILYTISASLPFLLAILILFNLNGHLRIINTLCSLQLSWPLSFFWALQLTTVFIVKLPMYSIHLWLPKAHVEAPVAGSILLAGILLKLGVYGLMRLTSSFTFILPLLLPLFLPVRLIGALLTRFICLRQTDFKSLIAYSSVSHMGLLAGGLFSGFSWGWQGALIIRVAHGLSSSALFALANMTYLTTSTRSLYLVKGLQILFPTIAFWWFLFCICNIAAPPSLNLLREILLITRTIARTFLAILPLAFVRFLTAGYSLFLFTALQHGAPRKQQNPLLLTSSHHHTVLLLHLVPLIIITLSPSIIRL